MLFDKVSRSGEDEDKYFLWLVKLVQFYFGYLLNNVATVRFYDDSEEIFRSNNHRKHATVKSDGLEKLWAKGFHSCSLDNDKKELFR